MRQSAPSIEPLEILLSETRDHPEREKLGLLCFEMLSHQAESRNLTFSKRILRLRAGFRGVSKNEAETVLGNIVTVLERGPERTSEWTLLTAFALLGLELKLTEANAAERREIVERFARHADFLEIATPYTLYRLVPLLLSDASQVALIEALETGLLAPQEGPSAAAFRARAMLRIHVLASFQRKEAEVVLARAVESSPDPAVRAAAREALGAAPLPSTEGFELRGNVGRVPRLSMFRVLGYITGISLLGMILRFVSYGLGIESTARVRLEPSAVHVHREARFFGRVVRVSDASYALNDIECATREVSMPAFQLFIGALAFGVGVVLSVIWLSDGLARSDTGLLLSAVIAFAAGAGLDLFFTGWGRLRKDRAGFEMYVDKQRVVALRRVDPERAQRFVEQIAQRRGSKASNSLVARLDPDSSKLF